MPTQRTNGGVGSAAKEVAEHARSIARLELKLAIAELKQKVTSLVLGIALGVAAAVFGLFALGFLGATIAAALATVLPTWLALLIVTLGFAALAGTCAVVGLGALRRGTPPVPEQAIHEAKLTAEAVRSNGGDRTE